MTRDEAIEIIESVSFFAPSDIDVDTALDMAIEALENNDKLAEDLQNCLEMYKKKKAEVEALKRKRGIWMPIEQGDNGYSAGDFICSCCGKPNKCYSVTDYCCSCGADMRGDND